MTVSYQANEFPAATVVPVNFRFDGFVVPITQLHRGALYRKEAAKYLSIGLSKLDELVAAGKIKKTSYATYPVESLNNHLRDEMQRKRK